jgi:hypothetical protein
MNFDLLAVEFAQELQESEAVTGIASSVFREEKVIKSPFLSRQERAFDLISQSWLRRFR